jgi:hypothetical protein
MRLFTEYISLHQGEREGLMRETQMRDIIVQAALTNSCSDLLRLLGDVERFGFHLKTLVVSKEDRVFVANMGLSIPCEADASFIATRFARHPEIASVVVHHGNSAPQRARASDHKLPT